MPRLSNFWGWTPAIAITMAVALLVTSFLLGVYSERSYRAEKIDAVDVQAHILASTIAAALSFEDRDAAQEYVNALAANPELRAAAIYDAAGRLFVGYARNTDPAPPATAPAMGARYGDEGLTVTVPVRQGQTVLGSVYVQTITEPFSRRLYRYGVIALLVTMTSLLVFVLGMGHRALRKVNVELEIRARQLSAANEELRTQIAEREKVEAALRQSQKMEAIGQLTGGVAHDFNNLLQVILGNLGIVESQLDSGKLSPSVLRKHVTSAIHGGERAAVLTRQLLAFSRRQPLAPTPLDINKLVASVTELVHRTLGEAIKIEAVLAGGIWRLAADANQLETALLNLAVNARDAMPQGGKLTIETLNTYLDDAYAVQHEGVQPGQYVMIAVSDTGTGMSQEVLLKAFEPFFTTKDVGKGTGLGLSQVYGFVKQSGGHVAIYSELGQGTTVKLYLPRLMAMTAPEDAPVDHPLAPAGGNQEDLILVVEDEADVRAFSVEILAQLGYAVVEAPNGHVALSILKANTGIKLLFTDVGLPDGLNGRQLADEAKKLRPDLKILYTSGYARNAIVHHGKLDPGVELLSKPFSAADLAKKVEAVMERS